MNVFADFHHGGLYASLGFLFEGRLGWNLYRPIGMEWFHEGYWKIGNPYPDPADTAKQYLEADSRFWGPFKSVNRNYVLEDGIYHIFDLGLNYHHKGITLETFRDMEFDIIIASLPSHIGPYRKLVESFQPKAKMIYQVGNDWGWVGTPLVKNVMASAIIPGVPADVHFISYHQEFDLGVFRKGEPHRNKNVYSFIHYMEARSDWGTLVQLEREMSDHNFRFFGAGNRDGNITEMGNLADRMREAMWIVHLKVEGDGYGHIVHNAFAVGRPLIVKASYYRGKLAEPLMVDGSTCVNLDGRSPQEAGDMIRAIVAEGRYEAMVHACRERFDRYVDFDGEEKRLRVFLDDLR